MGSVVDEGTATERLERQIARDVPSAFWLRPDWGDKNNLRDPGTVPFWMRPPRIIDVEIKKDVSGTEQTLDQAMIGAFIVDRDGSFIVNADGAPLVDNSSVSRPLSVRSSWSELPPRTKKG